MTIKDLFDVGLILQPDDNAKGIKDLDDANCLITGKQLNKRKIILHMKRETDGLEGNVFVKLKDDHQTDFPTSKKLLASKKVVGLSLAQFKDFDVEEL